MEAKACVAIGVSKPEGLDELPGAVAAAQQVAAWAAAAGYRSYPVVDVADGGGMAAVTVETLRGVFRKAFDGDNGCFRGKLLDHLIVFFAGHGLSPDFQDQLWLLTHWRTRGEQSVKLSSFIRLLRYYQPKRVSIIVDACRNKPAADDDTSEGTGVLEKPDEIPEDFPEDRFQSTEYDKAAYMVRAADEPTCLFSRAMLRGLSGALPDALEARESGTCVTSQGLYKAVHAAMAEASATWGVRQKPSLKPGFLRDQDGDVYARLPLDFQVAPMPRMPSSSRYSRDVGNKLDPAKALTPDTPLRPEVAYDKEYRPESFENDCGVVVSGQRLECPPTVPPWMNCERPQRGREWYRFKELEGIPTRPGSFVGETEAGFWVGAAIYPRRIAALSLAGSDCVSLVYRPSGNDFPRSPFDEFRAAEGISEALINRMLAGRLDNEARHEAAAQIRNLKHVDPTLGVIAAYLYDAAGDRESIRRMAWFYAEAREPIPFDVALLADLTGRRTRDGVLLVDLPPVPRREEFQSNAEAANPEYFRQTSRSRNVMVAGGFPWVRQGWGVLEAASLPAEPELLQIAKGLTRAPFTTLNNDAGRALAYLVKTGRV